ncbi:DUF4440 domain-containing protein [Streptomyces sp. A7024]|uniref:DUF4440 domain-containing protein n=1 Tax=Streptomyces coryli TaxID=1128680 RepID=A0A6G4U8S4_9ACTN|nr:YciI family protein [Streptomyces coryli]NGN68523.1 DUF4440 domain-containing protein [Streptomyces coryli]
MRYMLLICGDDSVDASGMAPIEPWIEEYGARRGHRLHGDRLRPAGEAVTVRVRGDEVLRSDGPFAETKEQVAGYDIVECDTLGQALAAAAAHPVAPYGAIEVRALYYPPAGADEIRRIHGVLTEGDDGQVAACYAPDAVVYGPAKVLQGAGATELRVEADEHSGFSHAVVGPYRVTSGFRAIGDDWRIVHQHISAEEK